MLHLASLLVPFSQQHCSLHVSVSHFGNSRDISNFFIIIIFVMVSVVFDVTAMTH